MSGDRRLEEAPVPRVSIVIPTYDEMESLPALLEELRAAMQGQASYEALFVDDGSRDGSGEWLDAQAAADSRVVVVHFRTNAGQSAAFAEGFRRARGEYVVTLDADGQNPPGEIPRLIAELDRGADVVAGYRAQRADTRWRLLQSRIANGIRNRVSGETIRDTGCSLKAFRARYLRSIPRFNGMHRFLPTLCRLTGAVRVQEIPVAHRTRQGGRSKYNMLNRALRGLLDLLAVRWLQKRWLRYEVRE